MSNTTKVFIAVLLLFIIILAAGFILSNYLEKSSVIMQEQIVSLNNYILLKDWDNAEQEMISIDDYWGKTKKNLTIITYHIVIEEISSSISRAKQLVLLKEENDLKVELSMLYNLIKNLSEEHYFTLRNIL